MTLQAKKFQNQENSKTCKQAEQYFSRTRILKKSNPRGKYAHISHMFEWFGGLGFEGLGFEGLVFEGFAEWLGLERLGFEGLGFEGDRGSVQVDQRVL